MTLRNKIIKPLVYRLHLVLQSQSLKPVLEQDSRRILKLGDLLHERGDHRILLGNPELEKPGILSNLVDVEFRLHDGHLVRQQDPVDLRVEILRVDAETSTSIENVVLDRVRKLRCVEIVHVDERFLEPVVSVNDLEVDAADASDSHDVEELHDSSLVVRALEARNVEAGVVVGSLHISSW